MYAKQSDATILIPGRLPDRAVEHLAQRFEIVRIETPDSALVDGEAAKKVRAIARLVTEPRIAADLIERLPNLEIISNLGVGFDGVDIPFATARGVVVTNTPDVLTEEVADAAVGLLIATIREFSRAEQWLRNGNWPTQRQYPPSRATLRTRHIGIFGLGRIGLSIAKRLEAFGLPIAYCNRRPVEGVAYAYHPTLVQLAAAVDTLISVAPATPSTSNAVDADVLNALGSEGVFINIGRGGTVDEPALVDALRDGTILAAGLDVYANEPFVRRELLALPNATLLPHLGSSSQHTRNKMADLMVENLLSWFDGKGPVTPVPS